VLENSLSDSKVKRLDPTHLHVSLLTFNQGLSEASYTANATLVFVAPSDVLPRVMERINNDIKPNILNGITDLDLGVWATPEGTMFVDGQYRFFNEKSEYPLSCS